MRPSLREDDFNTEKKVIIEEIRMYADQPPFGADDRLRATHFGTHPLGKSVLGTTESIAALPVEQMRAYFERRYSPGNMALVAAGRVDFDKLVQTAQTVCGDWQPVTTGRALSRATGHGPFECVEKDSATMEYLLQLANAPGADDDDRFAAKLMTTIIGDDSGSRLFWELVDPGRAENASLHHYDYQGTGIFMTYMSCDPEQAADNITRIERVYRDVQANGLTEAELAQAKSKINSRVVLGSERPRGRLFTVGGNWINRHEYRTVAMDLAAVDAVTIEEIAALLKKYPLTESTGIAVGPLAKIELPKVSAV
jgi:predicted Zn-dependent peptidase